MRGRGRSHSGAMPTDDNEADGGITSANVEMSARQYTILAKEKVFLFATNQTLYIQST